MIQNRPVIRPKVVFFENLDGLRAIAAFLVVITHIELHKKAFGIPAATSLPLQSLGRTGVTIFFSLSGFLITYLLLVERDNQKQISFKDFYMRRILRIWPLYFLVVIVGFFIYPAEGSGKALTMSVFFLPNLAFSLTLLPALFDPIWSIGTEEQFYIFHPHIFRIKSLKKVFFALIGIFFGLVIFVLIIRRFKDQSDFLADLSQFFYYARFTNMMLGAIVAVLYYNTKHAVFNFQYQRWFDLVFNRYVQIALLIAFVAFLSAYLYIDIPQADIVIALMSSLIIVNLCEPKTSILNLQNRYLTYCGKISYSIYLLHKFPLYLMLYIAGKYLINAGSFWQSTFVLVGTLVLVVALGSLSYFGYERYFLRLKTRFQTVVQAKKG